MNFGFRILEKKGSFYPQRKGWLGWSNFDDSYCSYDIQRSYLSYMEARIFLDSIRSGQRDEDGYLIEQVEDVKIHPYP